MRSPGASPSQRVDLSFFRVDVAVGPDEDERDRVAGAAWRAGSVGIEEHPDHLVVTFDDAAAASTFATDITAPPPRPVAPDAGLDEWRRHATPHRAGRFVVVPPWIDEPSAPTDHDTDIAIAVDPGRAFGDGGHPSTRAALRMIQTRTERPSPPSSILDLGAGSGVLSVAAARLGLAVQAVDIDPAAQSATLANAARNGVADRVVWREPHEVEPVEVVVVNMTIDLHESVGAPLVAEAAPKAEVIVAGVLAGAQAERAAAAYRRRVAAELVEAGSADLDGRRDEWAGLLLGR